MDYQYFAGGWKLMPRIDTAIRDGILCRFLHAGLDTGVGGNSAQVGQTRTTKHSRM